MSVATIVDIPPSITKKYGSSFSFYDLQKDILHQRLTKIKALFYDSKTDSYGPFKGDQAIHFLQLLDYEDSL